MKERGIEERNYFLKLFSYIFFKKTFDCINIDYFPLIFD